MKQVRVITDFKHPWNSPDYLYPDGCINDNNNHKGFMEALIVCMCREYSLLDLGCAGGQLVVDIMNKGFLGVGIEGGKVEEIISRGSGAENWKQYKDICLFSADISKPFTVVDEQNELIKFDLVTAWDVLEHPAPEEIPFVIDNIKNHLKPDGMFLGTLNPSESHDEFMRHRCPRPMEWWNEMFISKGFIVQDYKLHTTPRNYMDHVACFKLKKN